MTHEWYKGPFINYDLGYTARIVRGRPLIIWGGVVRIFANKFFFFFSDPPNQIFIYLFFLQHGYTGKTEKKIFFRVKLTDRNFFFFGGLLDGIFFFFSDPPNEIFFFVLYHNGRPLILLCICSSMYA